MNRPALAAAAAALSLLALTGCSQAETTLNKAASAAPNAAAAACSSSVAAATNAAATALPAGTPDAATPAINAALSTARSVASEVERTWPDWATRLTAAATDVTDAMTGYTATGDPAPVMTALGALASACTIPSAS